MASAQHRYLSLINLTIWFTTGSGQKMSEKNGLLTFWCHTFGKSCHSTSSWIITPRSVHSEKRIVISVFSALFGSMHPLLNTSYAAYSLRGCIIREYQLCCSIDYNNIAKKICVRPLINEGWGGSRSSERQYIVEYMMRRIVKYIVILWPCSLEPLIFARKALFEIKNLRPSVVCTMSSGPAESNILFLIHLLIFLTPRPPSGHTKTWFSYCRLQADVSHELIGIQAINIPRS